MKSKVHLRQFLDEIEDSDASVIELQRPEAHLWFQQWCEAFMQAVKIRTGRFRYRQLHWHAYSDELVRALDKRRAIDQYNSMPVESVIVIPESWNLTCGFNFNGNQLPDFSSLSDDVYVFPKTLDWSMSFTHEEGSGPYFSLREWCDGVST